MAKSCYRIRVSEGRNSKIFTIRGKSRANAEDTALEKAHDLGWIAPRDPRKMGVEIDWVKPCKKRERR